MPKLLYCRCDFKKFSVGGFSMKKFDELSPEQQKQYKQLMLVLKVVVGIGLVYLLIRLLF